jgi:hypothetical protein
VAARKRKWCGLCGNEVVRGGVRVVRKGHAGWYHKKCAPKSKRVTLRSPQRGGRRIHRKAQPLGSPNPMIDKITWLM